MKKSIFLALILTGISLVLLSTSGCQSSSGNFEYLPSKGWKEI